MPLLAGRSRVQQRLPPRQVRTQSSDGGKIHAYYTRSSINLPAYPLSGRDQYTRYCMYNESNEINRGRASYKTGTRLYIQMLQQRMIKPRGEKKCVTITRDIRPLHTFFLILHLIVSH